MRLLGTLLCALIAATAWAQDPEPAKRLTNQEIIGMVKMGLSSDVIIAKIRSVNGADAVKFDTSVEGLKALKDAGVPDDVIKTMINPAIPPAPVVTAATAVTLDPNLPPPEIGVYWKDGPTFVFIQGQAISNAKAGGRAGAYFTDGIPQLALGRHAEWPYVEQPDQGPRAGVLHLRAGRVERRGLHADQA